jgi:hypothetical protein
MHIAECWKIIKSTQERVARERERERKKEKGRERKRDILQHKHCT